jgi:integrase
LLHYSQVRVPHLAVPKEDAIRIDWLNQFFGPHTLSFITGSNCRAYVKWRSPRAKPQTARRELDTLGAAINLYNKEFRLDSVPVVTKPPPAQPREGWLERDQVAALLLAAHRRGQHHLVRFILISIYSGTRSQAVLKLRWLPSVHGGWIDLDRGLLYRRGTGIRETKKRTPPARLHARLAAHAKRWLRLDAATVRKDKEGNPLGPITHVIHYGGEPVEKLRRSWGTACKDAKIPEGIVKHNLRHTAATWLMQDGVDKWEACGYLGMTLETLDRVYGHHHPDYQRNAARLGTRRGQER